MLSLPFHRDLILMALPARFERERPKRELSRPLHRTDGQAAAAAAVAQVGSGDCRWMDRTGRRVALLHARLMTVGGSPSMLTECTALLCFSPVADPIDRSPCTACAHTESVWRPHTYDDQLLLRHRDSNGVQPTVAPSPHCTHRRRRPTPILAPCRTPSQTAPELRDPPNRRRRSMHSHLLLRERIAQQHRSRRCMSPPISHTRLRRGKRLRRLRLRLQALPPMPLPLRVRAPTRVHRVVSRPLPPPPPLARSFCRI